MDAAPIGKLGKVEKSWELVVMQSWGSIVGCGGGGRARDILWGRFALQHRRRECKLWGIRWLPAVARRQPCGSLKVTRVKGLWHGRDDRMTPGTLANQVPRLGTDGRWHCIAALPPALAVLLVWSPFALSSPSPDQLHPPVPVSSSPGPQHFIPVSPQPPPSITPATTLLLSARAESSFRASPCCLEPRFPIRPLSKSPSLPPCQPSARAVIHIKSSLASRISHLKLSPGNPAPGLHTLESSVLSGRPASTPTSLRLSPGNCTSTTARWPVTPLPPSPL